MQSGVSVYGSCSSKAISVDLSSSCRPAAFLSEGGEMYVTLTASNTTTLIEALQVSTTVDVMH